MNAFNDILTNDHMHMPYFAQSFWSDVADRHIEYQADDDSFDAVFNRFALQQQVVQLEWLLFVWFDVAILFVRSCFSF